ncbi:MipA/OmpV family protein [Kordiimonas sp. SCSIO 12610]|uniref:MipA/OmpV family protein n=1 Tax=Kordiimonas sp. SCSIO 12610 TaxID=2829597 RepID=UPI00210B5FD2|nr:MipA/OmpV family protein [Kordiimonas sp. SCSIO 12610]UTW55252.1 MipA/OmpV family protein [Kordiimonas sp. SCSIO 12610]
MRSIIRNFHFSPFRILALKRAIFLWMNAFFFTLVINFNANAQGTGIFDRFSDALETVQDGLELILPDDVDMKNDVRVQIGLGNGFVPDYSGSNNYRYRFLPMVNIRYKDLWHLNNGRLNIPLYHKGNFEVGPLVNLLFGRQENRNAALAGLGDINTTIEIGTYVRYRTKATLIEANFRQALGAGQGRSLRITAGQGIYKNGDFSLALAGRARWQSREATQTNYGITAEQAENSSFGLTEFQTTAGFSEINGNLIGSYELTEQTRLLGLLSYGRLLGDAANSPLVSGNNGDGIGSSNQFIGGIAISYRFQ